MTRAADLTIATIRRDGGTQGRLHIDEEVIRQYAELMATGTRFPPVRVWFDGEHHWLADGFQRLAAAERARISHFPAEIRSGTVVDAQWDSFSANTRHGLRLSKNDIANVVERALRHPRAAKMSNMEMARHLGIPETTLRRIRKSCQTAAGRDAVRVVKRKGKTYSMNTGGIGRAVYRRPQRRKTLEELRLGFERMRTEASGDTRRVLNVLEKWALGSADSSDCLRALEGIVRDWKGTGLGAGVTSNQ